MKMNELIQSCCEEEQFLHSTGLTMTEQMYLEREKTMLHTVEAVNSTPVTCTEIARKQIAGAVQAVKEAAGD